MVCSPNLQRRDFTTLMTAWRPFRSQPGTKQIFVGAQSRWPRDRLYVGKRGSNARLPHYSSV